MSKQIKIAFVHAEHGHNDKGIGEGITDYIRDKGHHQIIAWPDSSFESLSFLKQGSFLPIVLKFFCSTAITKILLCKYLNVQPSFHRFNQRCAALLDAQIFPRGKSHHRHPVINT